MHIHYIVVLSKCGSGYYHYQRNPQSNQPEKESVPRSAKIIIQFRYMNQHIKKQYLNSTSFFFFLKNTTIIALDQI